MNTFKGVADTLFIPLTARIYVSQRFPEYFYDSKAVELSSILPDNNIQKNSSEYSMLASVARSYTMDEMIKNFIAAHPTCNIINLGCGLETTCSRIASTTATFYELDLPKVIESRRTLLKEQPHETYITGDLFNLEWTDCIEDRTCPTLFIAAGVFQYFHEAKILRLIKELRSIFTKAELIFDATNKAGLAYAQRYVKKTGNTSAMMYFFVDNCETFANKAGVTLLEQRPFFTATQKILGRKISLSTRLIMKFADGLGRTKILHLKLS